MLTFTLLMLFISAAVASNACLPRAVMTTFTPSRASAIAQPLPRPFEAAHTKAVRPRIPSSIVSSF
jgi:hypothetical protein